MASAPKQREKIIELVPWSFHKSGDCNCRERVIHTGRFYGGSEACGRCGKLQGKREFRQPPRRLLGIRYGGKR